MGKLSSFFKIKQFQIRSEVYCYQWWPLILWAGDQLWAKMSFSGEGWGDAGACFGAGCEHASIRQQGDCSPPGLPDLPGASRDIHDCCAPECIGGGSCGCSRQRQLPWNSSSSIPPSPASPTLFSLLLVLRQWLYFWCWWGAGGCDCGCHVLYWQHTVPFPGVRVRTGLGSFICYTR